jgi:hypothetical protein
VHWFWIAPLCLLIIYLFSPRFRGDIAESRVRRILAAGLEKNRYTVLNDVTIPSNGGTSHIDHIVVSKFGIFVIESQYAQGQISGGEFQAQWKQQHFGRSRRLDNPMHRNALQVEALARLLTVPVSKFIPIVVMAGQKDFKSAMPENLLEPGKLIAYMRKNAQQRLESDQANRLIKAIGDARIHPGRHGRANRWALIRWLLIAVLIGGAYLAFRGDISDLQSRISEKTEKDTSPELFRPDGSRKSERELWEDSLLCAYSQDTGRCSCYEPGGDPVDLEPARCRSLAERGSVLKQ